ncbi:hypothetical protein Btru_034297 [Bulinus truncatus]|nr:hypothetical protein Btru_034297 [Bulinus truncatus]
MKLLGTSTTNEIDSTRIKHNMASGHGSARSTPPVLPNITSTRSTPTTSLTMNAKYDALKMAIDMGHVETKYLAWVDIGYYRHKDPRTIVSPLQVPLDFDETKIGFTEVGGREYSNLSPWDYIRDNHVWVAGGFILGTIPNMSSTDQQVIGAMYSPQMIREQEVQMKVYPAGTAPLGQARLDAQYFCLGYKCKEAAEIRKANTSLVSSHWQR